MCKLVIILNRIFKSIHSIPFQKYHISTVRIFHIPAPLPGLCTIVAIINCSFNSIVSILITKYHLQYIMLGYFTLPPLPVICKIVAIINSSFNSVLSILVQKYHLCSVRIFHASHLYLEYARLLQYWIVVSTQFYDFLFKNFTSFLCGYSTLPLLPLPLFIQKQFQLLFKNTTSILWRYSTLAPPPFTWKMQDCYNIE
jgi:hypothetical protein